MLSSGNPLIPLRRERERQGRKNEVLDAAEQIFRRKGYHLATTEEIARDAGYSVGTLYNLFTDKEGLYAAVLERSGEQLLARLASTVLRQRNPHAALEDLIKLRLYNHVRDQLFFQAFSCEGQLGIQPEPSRLPRAVSGLYDKYLQHVESIFARALERENLTGLAPLPLALGMEAMINVYMGYWTRAGRSGSVESTAAHIRDILLSPVTLARIGALASDELPRGPEPPEINISRFDLERLKELITVARCFGKSEDAPHLDELETRLRAARVVNPRDVPPDLVTMNTVARLGDLDTQREIICALVFPIDAECKNENVSILDPLGTALLGHRRGDVFAVQEQDGARQYQVREILYQPEAAGDYHR